MATTRHVVETACAARRVSRCWNTAATTVPSGVVTPNRSGQENSPPNGEGNTRPVHTQGKLARVPNQPKTPVRGFRIPDELYKAAQDAARYNDEDLTKIVRDALKRYVDRTDRKKRNQERGTS